MKLLIAFLSLAFSGSVFGAEIKSAKYDPLRRGIEMDVVYNGGCKNHSFKIQVVRCSEGTPLVCTAQLVDKAVDDQCDSLIRRTVLVKLSESGLDDTFYSKALLVIRSARGIAATSVLLP